MPLEENIPSTDVPLSENNLSEIPQNINSNNKEYESSELSDLGEDQSEAETDKMDFLDEENHDNQSVSDLNALLKLTELARLREIDSDDDDDSNIDKSSPFKRKREEEEEPIKKAKIEHDEDEADGEDEFEEEGSEPENEPEPEPEPLSAIPVILEAKQEIDEGDDKREDNNGDVEQSKVVENGDSTENINDTVPDDNDGKAEKEDNEEDEQNDAENEDEDGEIEGENGDSENEEDDDDVDINEQRMLAVQDLVDIEKSFAEVRDKLYHDKLKFLEHELQLCLEGSHPELAKIYYKINGFYQESIRLANHTLNYRLRCINNETIATRTSIHQNFLKQMIDNKNDLILETTSKWYNINKERNQMDQLVPDFTFKAIPDPIQAPEPEEIPNNGYSNGYTNGYTNGYINNGNGNGTTHTMNGNGYNPYNEYPPYEAPLTKKEIKQTKLVELVQQRNDYNQQLGIINGLVRMYGLPSAIDLSLDGKSKIHEILLKSATDDEISQDLKAMGISI